MTSFAYQHVERACGRGVVHRFQTDAAFEEFGEHTLRRKYRALAGAKQHEFRIQCKDRFDRARVELIDATHWKIFDDPAWTHYETRMHAPIDDGR